MPLEAESSFQIGKAAGDYVISRLISKGTNTSTWAATQVSVQREVLVCSLDDAYLDDHQTRAEFIADVRIKAAVDHPLIASILEAVNEGPLCFFAYEKINGKDLGDLHEQGKLISPLHVARIIKNVSSACEHLEATQVATLPLSPHDIFVDRDYHCRLHHSVTTVQRHHNGFSGKYKDYLSFPAGSTACIRHGYAISAGPGKCPAIGSPACTLGLGNQWLRLGAKCNTGRITGHTYWI